MNRYRPSLADGRLALVFALVVLGLAGSAWTDTTPITFTFNPPDGTTCVQTVKKTRTDYEDGLKRLDTSTVKDKRKFKRTPNGWTMTITPISSEHLRDGIPIDYTKAKPGGDMGVVGTLTYVIDNTGKATEVKGVREALTAMANKICARITDAEKAQQIKDRFTRIEPSATAEALNDFNDTFGGYSGSAVTVGASTEGESYVDFPGGGRVVSMSHITVPEKLTYAGHECVKLRYETTYDPEKLRAAMAHSPDMSGSQVTSAQMSTITERIVNPATMLCYAETSRRGLRLSISDPAGTSTSGYDETEETTFDYTAADAKPVIPASVEPLAEPLKPGQVRFRYNPPDGAKFLERVKESHYVGRTSGRDLTLAITTIQGCSVRKTDTGYTVVSSPLSMETTVNGHLVPLGGIPSERVLARSATLARQIDNKGRITSIDGLDNYFANLSKLAAMNGSTRAVGLLPALRGGVESAVKREWEERVGSYVGKTMSIGELWQTQEKIPAYSGDVTVNQRTRFVGQEIRDGHTCARLRTYFEADSKVVKREIGDAIHDYLEEDGIADLIKAPVISNVSFTGAGDRLIDPETMFLYSDSMNYTSKFTMTVSGHKFTFSSNGKEECSFEYNAPESDSTGETAPSAGGTTAPAAPDNSAIARDMVDCLARADYASVIKKFDTAMTAALPEGKLRANWEIITGAAGQFQSQSSVRTESRAGFDMVIVTCKFEKSSIDVQFSFNDKKQISGLYFRPAEK